MKRGLTPTKYENAMKAIVDLFNDRSVSVDATKDNLQALVSEINIMIASLPLVKTQIPLFEGYTDAHLSQTTDTQKMEKSDSRRVARQNPKHFFSKFGKVRRSRH